MQTPFPVNFPPVPLVSDAWHARAHRSFISLLSWQRQAGHQHEVAAPATPRTHLGGPPISFHAHGGRSQGRWLPREQPLRCHFFKSKIYKKYTAGSRETPGSCRWVSEANRSHHSAAAAVRMGESSGSSWLLCFQLETIRSPVPRGSASSSPGSQQLSTGNLPAVSRPACTEPGP